MRKFFLPVFLCVPLLLVGAACIEGDGNNSGGPAGNQQQVSGAVPLHDARLDLADRLDIAPLEIDLVSIRSAGFDGCLGVREPDTACTDQFIGGYIAMYEANGQQYRYHFGGERFVYADPAKQIDDGLDVEPELAPDLNRQLAGHAREDLDLRVVSDVRDAVVTAILPGQFPDGCMGFVPADVDACDAVIVEGAVVFLLGGDGNTYRYHVGGNGVIATDFEDGEITFEANPAVRVQQQLMREDLARRLSVPTEQVGVLSYREVTWPDGCLGVYLPDALCSQALVEGSLAILTGPDGKEYRYHASEQGSFVAASFEASARVEDPLPRQSP
jgi:hypothetical protein